MKRMLILALIGLVLISFSSAECDLSISMINQDPYPAVPGDYVKVVFQVAGIEDPSCKEVSFELLEQYPIVFDPDQKRIYEIEAGTYSVYIYPLPLIRQRKLELYRSDKLRYYSNHLKTLNR